MPGNGNCGEFMFNNNECQQTCMYEYVYIKKIHKHVTYISKLIIHKDVYTDQEPFLEEISCYVYQMFPKDGSLHEMPPTKKAKIGNIFSWHLGMWGSVCVGRSCACKM